MKYDQLDITNAPSANQGGICSLQFVPIDYISAMHAPSLATGSIDTAIVLHGGKDWHSFACNAHSLRFDESQAEADGGIYYKQELSGTLSKDELERNVALQAMAYKHFVALYRGRNNVVKIVGTIDSPLSFSSVFDTNTSPGTGAKFQFVFTGQAEERAPHYNV